MGWKRIATIAGIALFVIGVGLAYTLARGENRAEQRDRREPASFPQDVPVDPCVENLALDVFIGQRVMTVQSSQTLRVMLTNETKEACPAVLLLSAPRFDVDPPQFLRTITVGSASVAEIAWVLAPTEPGTYDVAVAAGNSATILGITVTNVLGLRAWQIQLLSILGTFLGPMLTLPWWYEQWQKRRQASEKQEKRSPSGRRLPFE